MTTHLLQSAQWPRGVTVGAPEGLYYRAAPRANWIFSTSGTLHASQERNGESVLDFGTFFGAFSLTTWCGSAGLDEITLEIRFRGRCTLRIFEDNGYEGSIAIWEQRVESDGSPLSITLDGLKAHRGILYPVLQLQRGDEIEFIDLAYSTSHPPVRKPSLAIVMPTFRREAYARRNVELIGGELNRAGATAHCKLFIVDNGQSLDLANTPGVELIHNRNFGGSGGFARGLIEAGRDGTTYSHVLFCDDDVLIDPQAIRRLLALLGYISADEIVSGGMLKMGLKHVLHEKSANVLGMHFSSNKSNLDLNDRGSVARYDEGTFNTFCGWWFVCYPLAAHPESFMPAPFFVGWDDVEMGQRCKRLKLRTISLLGLTVWHDEFEKKDINWRWYYHTRNGLITALLYEENQRALRQTLIEIMNALLTYRYERAEFMIDGLAAVNEGSRSITSKGGDEIHAGLVKRQRNLFTDVSHSIIPDRYLRRLPPSRWRKFFARVTMGGHLLPLFLFKSAQQPSDAGWVVENLHSRTLVRIFRCPRVVYYEPTTGKGMICDIDHSRYYRLLGRLLVTWLRLSLNWSRLRRHWRADHSQLTSKDFWERYLGVQQGGARS